MRGRFPAASLVALRLLLTAACGGAADEQAPLVPLPPPLVEPEPIAVTPVPPAAPAAMPPASHLKPHKK